jgi:16S rRNA (cytosine1402-N4)-methyltransferase
MTEPTQRGPTQGGPTQRGPTQRGPTQRGPTQGGPIGQGESQPGHIPVMLDAVLATLAPRDGGIYLDGTFGGGGYARAILEHADCTLWAIDRDPEAIERGASLMSRFPARLHLLHGQFADMVALLNEAGVTALDGVVLDLGVSSFQIDDPARGFSFRQDGPLDMRMGKHGTSAADLVNTLPEPALADVLYELGEERASRRIAHAIVAARLEAPIETTGRLAEIIRSVLPPDRSGNHPATRSFQALRIKVNDELQQIEAALRQAAGLLSPGGRLVVVAFHSLEDRIVKRFMTTAAGRTGSPSRHNPAGLLTRDTPSFSLLTARALRPGSSETTRNPRSRSARLRALERIAKGRDT